MQRAVFQNLLTQITLKVSLSDMINYLIATRYKGLLFEIKIDYRKGVLGRQGCMRPR